MTTSTNTPEQMMTEIMMAAAVVVSVCPDMGVAVGKMYMMMFYLQCHARSVVIHICTI